MGLMRIVAAIALCVVCGAAVRAQDAQPAATKDPAANASQDGGAQAQTQPQNSQASPQSAQQPAQQQGGNGSAQQSAASGGGGSASAQSAGGASASASASAKKGNAGGGASATGGTAEAAEADERGGNIHTLSGAVSIPLGGNWARARQTNCHRRRNCKISRRRFASARFCRFKIRVAAQFCSWRYPTIR